MCLDSPSFPADLCIPPLQHFPLCPVVGAHRSTHTLRLCALWSVAPRGCGFSLLLLDTPSVGHGPRTVNVCDLNGIPSLNSWPPMADGCPCLVGGGSERWGQVTASSSSGWRKLGRPGCLCTGWDTGFSLQCAVPTTASLPCTGSRGLSMIPFNKSPMHFRWNFIPAWKRSCRSGSYTKSIRNPPSCIPTDPDMVKGC